jgi:MFS family permease
MYQERNMQIANTNPPSSLTSTAKNAKSAKERSQSLRTSRSLRFNPIGSNADKPPTKAALALIFTILLLDVIGISMLYPIAAYLVLRYSSDAFMITLLTVIYAAAQFVAAPLLGKLGDRYGRRPVLLISLAGSAIGYTIFGIGGALWVLFVSRLIDGITAGNQSVAAAYIADVSAPEARAKNFALIGMAWGIGLIIGPASGAALGQWQLDAPAFLAAGLSLLSLALSFFWLLESLPAEQRAATPLRLGDLNPFGAILVFVGKPGLGALLLALCLFNFAFQGINSIESLFLIKRFAAQPWQIGALLVIAGVTIAAVNRIVPPLTARYGEQRIAQASLLLIGLGALATCVAPALWLIVPINVARTIASGLVFPTLGALMTGRAAPREAGALMGVTTALGSFMTILGPLWAGAVYDRVMPSAPFWMGAGVFTLAAGLLLPVPLWVLRTGNQPSVPPFDDGR